MLDLDDTLFLERDYIRSGFEAVGYWTERRFGIRDFAERAYERFLCGGRETIFDKVLLASGICPSPRDINNMVQVYRKHNPRISLLPDAEEFLAFFHGRCRLALISDGWLESQKRKLKALRLDRRFAPVVFTDAWGREYWKPNRRAFLHIQDAAEASPRDCVYIADNPAKDFDAPLALGWRTARVRREAGICAHMDSKPGREPEMVVSDLRQLIPILAGSIEDGGL